MEAPDVRRSNEVSGLGETLVAELGGRCDRVVDSSGAISESTVLEGRLTGLCPRDARQCR